MKPVTILRRDRPRKADQSGITPEENRPYKKKIDLINRLNPEWRNRYEEL
jgi:hypothetical protein